MSHIPILKDKHILDQTLFHNTLINNTYFVMVTLNSVQLLIKKRTFSVSFTLSVKGKINNKHNKKRKEEKESKKVSKQERKRESSI